MALPSVFGSDENRSDIRREIKKEVKPGLMPENVPVPNRQLEMRQKMEMSSLDIRFAVKEIRAKLSGGIIQKIYQYGDSKTKQLLFEIYSPAIGLFKLYIDDNKIFITKKKEMVPIEPPSFCMLLRKHLMGKKINDIYQHGFDSIVEMKIDSYILIFEMIKPGNIILCDSYYNIIMPLEVQRWRSREIKPKKRYVYPPAILNPFSLKFSTFRDMAKVSDKKIAAFLAREMGLGGIYARELCKRANVDEQKPTSSINIDQLIEIYKYMQAFNTAEVKPVIYKDVVSPFPLKSIDASGDTRDTFCDALDDYFSDVRLQMKIEEEKEREAEETQRIGRIIETHEKAKEKWEAIQKEEKSKADLIYNYYSIVESAINAIQKAKESGLPWEEIKAIIAESNESVKEIRENEGIVVLNLGGTDVEIDFRKSVEDNAARYFEDAKWAKKKLEGVIESQAAFTEKAELEKEQTALDVFAEEKPKMRIEPVESETKVMPEREKEEVEGVEQALEVEPAVEESRKEKPRWYEKYRWFISSDGFVVIAGKNAEQNEMIINKHTEKNDIVYHANIPGAAFVVIKAEGKEIIPESTRKEAAEFSAANSKAWSKGLSVIDVYAVKPEQVSKSPPSGEYLPKGSFMINGERVWYRNTELKLSIGVKVDKASESVRVLCGPVMATRINSDYFVTIRPGFKKATELARAIKNKILIKAKPDDKFLIERIGLDEFEKLIPGGMGEIVEYG